MKKVFLSMLVIALAMSAEAQSVDSAISNEMNLKLQKFSSTLEYDSIALYYRSDAVAFNLDTVYVPINSAQTFDVYLNVKNTVTWDIGKATKRVTIKNVKGVYSLYTEGDYPAYSGEKTVANAKWNIVMSGNFVVVQCTGVANTPIGWQATVKNIPPQY